MRKGTLEMLDIIIIITTVKFNILIIWRYLLTMTPAREEARDPVETYLASERAQALLLLVQFLSGSVHRLLQGILRAPQRANSGEKNTNFGHKKFSASERYMMSKHSLRIEIP